MSESKLDVYLELDSDEFSGSFCYEVHYSYETLYPDNSPNGGSYLPVIDKVMNGGRIIKVDNNTEEVLLDKVYEHEGLDN